MSEDPNAIAVADVYPSRTGDATDPIPRRDPVVYGDADSGPLDDALRRYDRDGYLYFDRLFSSVELEPYQAELDRLRDLPGVTAKDHVITEPGSGSVRSIFGVHNNAVLGALCRDQRLVNIARQILGSEVYLHQTRINYKPGFRGKEFYWHSDFETWHVEDGMPRMRAVSCSVSLTDNHPAAGPLLFIPGSHETFIPCHGETPENHYESSLKKQEYGIPDDRSLRSLADETDVVATSGGAGSVVFFDCNLMHGSGSNITPWPRSNVFIVFNSVENSLVDPFCGLEPRPEFIANRNNQVVVEPH